ncbi:hypothetical protein GY964_26785, partial [Klebsiella pneumoniae]|uniref:hypothetical protein n=1 Tax=Klebsiella pneumoniae TaxID=573 RepID=UPI0015C4DE11
PEINERMAGGATGTIEPDTCANTFCTEDAETFRDYCPRHGPGRTGFEPRPSSNSTDIDALRRDVARLEGKVDALLAALDV